MAMKYAVLLYQVWELQERKKKKKKDLDKLFLNKGPQKNGTQMSMRVICNKDGTNLLEGTLRGEL